MKSLNVKRFAGAAVLALTLVASAVVGVAQQGRGFGGKHGGFGGHRGGFGRMFGGLDLTDAQRTQIQQIAERYRQSTNALREQAHAAGQGANAFDGTFDEAAVRAAAQRRAAAQVELEVAHARMYSEMYAVLTPEQKARLAEMRQQREQRRREWEQRRDAQRNNAQTGGTSES